MLKFLPLIGLLLFSCTNDCTECEQMLNECMMYEPIPVDLPTPDPEPTAGINDALTIKVTAEDKYIVEGEIVTLDELTALVVEKMDSESLSKLKIEGDKMAHYATIFSLISLAQEKGLNPILAYRN